MIDGNSTDSIGMNWLQATYAHSQLVRNGNEQLGDRSIVRKGTLDPS